MRIECESEIVFDLSALSAVNDFLKLFAGLEWSVKMKQSLNANEFLAKLVDARSCRYVVKF